MFAQHFPDPFPGGYKLQVSPWFLMNRFRYPLDQLEQVVTLLHF